MMSLSNYAENATLDHWLRNVSVTSPTTVYMALFSTDPGEATGGTELTVGTAPGYARQAITFGPAAAGISLNSAPVVFTSTGAAWTTATHAAIFDALTAGNRIFVGPLAAPRTVDAGGTLTFAVGQISASLD